MKLTCDEFDDYCNKVQVGQFVTKEWVHSLWLAGDDADTLLLSQVPKAKYLFEKPCFHWLLES